MEIWKTAARADGKTIHNLTEKDKPFPTGLQTAFPQPRNSDSLRTFPQRLLRRLSILSHESRELPFFECGDNIINNLTNRNLRRDCYEKGIGIIWGINLHVVIRRL